MLETIAIRALEDNYIWLIKEPNSSAVAVVDPGEAAPIQAYLKKEGLDLAAILVTHHHADHTDGIAALVADKDVPIYGPKQSPYKGTNKALVDGDTIQLFGFTLNIKATPGHTLDHICYFLDAEHPQLFSGDTLFLAGCGRLFEGTPEQMYQAMLYCQNLPKQTRVYAAHEYSLSNLNFAACIEPDNQAIKTAIKDCQALRKQQRPTLPSLIETELAINPFLRTEQDSVRQAVSEKYQQTASSNQQVFSLLREWKNNY